MDNQQPNLPPQDDEVIEIPVRVHNPETVDEVPASNNNQPPQAEASPVDDAPASGDQNMNARLERLGGEPAPDITPEEFAHLRQSGHLHIDPRGRVRSPRFSDSSDSGVSLRKRRAWY